MSSEDTNKNVNGIFQFLQRISFLATDAKHEQN
jgi:hypothetical protein